MEKYYLAGESACKNFGEFDNLSNLSIDEYQKTKMAKPTFFQSFAAIQKRA